MNRSMLRPFGRVGSRERRLPEKTKAPWGRPRRRIRVRSERPQSTRRLAKENRGAFLSLNNTIPHRDQTVGPPFMSFTAAGVGLGGAMSLLALVLIR